MGSLHGAGPGFLSARAGLSAVVRSRIAGLDRHSTIRATAVEIEAAVPEQLIAIQCYPRLGSAISSGTAISGSPLSRLTAKSPSGQTGRSNAPTTRHRLSRYGSSTPRPTWVSFLAPPPTCLRL